MSRRLSNGPRETVAVDVRRHHGSGQYASGDGVIGVGAHGDDVRRGLVSQNV